ncbi:MAG: D-tyrosyl-tRNA(Tyr) deacylase [Pirellulaceae bacterium]|nr:D-tyrosyl-tRNA(Tyr) deacylase [Pirellulaceae bacterium]
MRAVVQRVSRARVTVGDQVVGQIEVGLAVLLGVEQADQPGDAKYLAEKVAGLRIFDDQQGRMNLSVEDVGGSVLAVSQFTLLGDVRRGKRPSFTGAMEPQSANRLYQHFCDCVRQRNLNVQQGVFQADMQVELINNGPVTILLDSKKLF